MSDSPSRGFIRGTLFTVLFTALLGTIALATIGSRPSYDSLPAGTSTSVKSGNEGPVRPGNEARLLRMVPGKSRIAFLYIHGFGASRAEGEFIMDKIARRYRANTYYLRLPGHGSTAEAQARTGYRDYLRAAETALFRMEKLGERVIVVGTSMGGLLTTHLASRYPERIAAIALASPFYDYASPTSVVLKSPGGLSLIKLVRGPRREHPRKKGDVNDPRLPGFENFWYVRQYYQALRGLEDLRAFVAQPAVYRRIRAPVLMFYYYGSEEKQDPAASVPAMLNAFSVFGSAGHRHPLSRPVAAARGNHILFSKWIRGVDHGFIEKEMIQFLDLVIASKK